MKTDYRSSGASALVSYLDKEQGQGLYNRYGEEMTDAEVQAFIDKSERHNFERQVIISPENREDLADEEMSLYARQTMQEFTEDRPTADYCYTIHRDTDDPHVQVAVTGERDDLYMNEQDIASVREDAHRQFVEQHQENTPTLEEEHEYERRLQEEQEQEEEQEQDMGFSL